MKSEQLKAKAYDMLAQIQNLQQELQDLNKEIGMALQEEATDKKDEKK